MAANKKKLPVPSRVALKAARERAGQTRAQLAVQLGVDPSTVARWETGESYPSRLAIAALRSMFPGVTL